jgi:hypothetical protein
MGGRVTGKLGPAFHDQGSCVRLRQIEDIAHLRRRDIHAIEVVG